MCNYPLDNVPVRDKVWLPEFYGDTKWFNRRWKNAIEFLRLNSKFSTLTTWKWCSAVNFFFFFHFPFFGLSFIGAPICSLTQNWIALMKFCIAVKLQASRLNNNAAHCVGFNVKPAEHLQMRNAYNVEKQHQIRKTNHNNNNHNNKTSKEHTTMHQM